MCRFPSAATSAELWKPLCDEVDAVESGIAVDFEPGEFAVTARENATLDPQHRALLVCARDALLDAGTDPNSLAGEDIGVFMGQSTGEHWDSLPGPADMYAIATAAARSMASGRISYAWDLRGPCTTVDAACSSGTLAVHLACQSLRTGECDTALAGGVSLVLGTDHTNGCAAAGMLSPTGRCRFAHDEADGFVRSDGAGVLVLKRLSSVRPDETVHALILGSAQASKGRTAKAIIAPSIEGYLQVIGRATAVAGIEPARIAYVEAHGNAAPAGDLIELQAIGAAVGTHLPPGHPVPGGLDEQQHRPPRGRGRPGQVDEGSTGRAPPQGAASLHSDQPTAQVDWAGLNIAPVTGVTDWPDAGPAVAGVSAYGLSGVFVHILVGSVVS